MVKAKNLTTIVNFILDRSGSMESIKPQVIKGFNSYIKDLQGNKEANIKFSLTTFDTEGIDTPYEAAPIRTVEPLTNKTYVPRGGTPLYDAVVESVEKLAEQVGKKKNTAVLVAIMTDGEENSSTRHDEKCLKDLIEKLEKKGNWTFAFMGANQDAWGNANRFGMSGNNVVAFAATAAGMDMAFDSLTRGTTNYVSQMNTNLAKGIKLSASNIFDQNDSQP